VLDISERLGLGAEVQEGSTGQRPELARGGSRSCRQRSAR
jgi:hypothetical protein